MTIKKLVEKITQLIFEKKGSDVKVIELKEVSSVADYFILCSADSDTQVQAIAEHLDKSLREKGIRLWHKEGTTALQWVLLDYVDVVIHVFQKETRAFYNLEKLWGDAAITAVEDKPKKVRAAKLKVKAEGTAKKSTAVKAKTEKSEPITKKSSAGKPRVKKEKTSGAND